MTPTTPKRKSTSLLQKLSSKLSQAEKELEKAQAKVNRLKNVKVQIELDPDLEEVLKEL